MQQYLPYVEELEGHARAILDEQTESAAKALIPTYLDGGPRNALAQSVGQDLVRAAGAFFTGSALRGLVTNRVSN